ncbi:hypothetical protein [Streptomyces sp. NPDC058092]|uniref:hypothetical protein n=1 Tax=Streptomyces sp. NPDC058092 TaxID=3346336 RepID=UPI0036E438CE
MVMPFIFISFGVERQSHVERYGVEGGDEVGRAVAECAGEEAGGEQGESLEESDAHVRRLQYMGLMGAGSGTRPER